MVLVAGKTVDLWGITGFLMLRKPVMFSIYQRYRIQDLLAKSSVRGEFHNHNILGLQRFRKKPRISVIGSLFIAANNYRAFGKSFIYTSWNWCIKLHHVDIWMLPTGKITSWTEKICGYLLLSGIFTNWRNCRNFALGYQRIKIHSK